MFKEREKGWERWGPTKCHPNSLTSEVGIMEGRRAVTVRGCGLGEVGQR